MIHASPILAATDPTQIIIGVVFFVIWAVSALMSHLAKKHEAERRRRVREQIEHGGVTPPSQPSASPVPQRMQRTAHRPPPPPKPKPKAPKKQFAIKAPRTTPPPLFRTEPAPAVSEAPVVISAAHPAQAPATSTASHHPTGTSAKALHAWLRPDTMRQQFILTEVLQPPVALRERPW
jgi:hypothetical protein